MVARIHAERLRVTLGYEGLFYLDNDGLSGGLALFWRRNNTASLLSYSKNHVDVEVRAENGKQWRMTCFYVHSDRSRRWESWELLDTLKTRSLLPWVVIGDFNNLLFQYEKRGGNPYPDNLLRGFGETLDGCGLMQLPMRGHQFTWEKSRGTENWIEERLDKVLATADWCGLNENVEVENIIARPLDHSALFLSMDVPCMRRGRIARGFRFEMAWFHDEGCRDVVVSAWQGGRVEGLLNCQQRCGERLMRWGGGGFHKFGERIGQLRKRQGIIRNRRDPAALAEFHQIDVLLAQLEVQEDVFWRQRAKIKNNAGIWVEGNNMCSVILDYFRDIYATENTACDDALFDDFMPRISHDQNESLLRPFGLEDVKETLKSMYPDKAPGPNGMNPGFYQHFWDKNVPETVADMRLIALSNVIYRVMAKMITNRMKPLMGELISESQSAFIPGRLIKDNILVAAEVGHYLNRKQYGLTGWSALKLDMSKAYDRMEWPFLQKMLCAIGFDQRWVKLIMLCVTTVNYTIMVNGMAGGQKAQMEGAIHGCRVARGAPPVSHLFFADDSLLFFKVNIEEAGRNKRAVFSYVEDKIRQRIGSWSKMLLTQAGKEVLLKSVAQSMPTFSMSVFLLPEMVCTSIERTMNSGYWWGTGAERKIHWKTWDKLCIPKKYGGLGFKDLRAFNLAMLGKQAWRFLTNPSILAARIYKARYYPNTSFIDATIGNCPSFCWRSIMAAHGMVCSGVRRRIGNGAKTLIWGHPWLPDNPNLFIPEDVARITMIPVSPDYEDTWYWKGEKNGVYSVKNAYRQIKGDYEHNPEDQCGLAAAVLYSIWNARNAAVWEHALPWPNQTWQRAVAAMHAYQRSHPPACTPPPTVMTVASGSETPRCYVDARYRSDTGEAMYGVVLLSHHGAFVAVTSGKLSGAFSAIMAEALACKEALSWLKDRDIMEVDILTDCLELRNALHSSPTANYSYFGIIVDQCRTAISLFTKCSLSYVSRTLNFHAHTLASLAFDQEQSMYWDSVPPNSVIQFIH
ncbi:PREDICTED: uncharacterized protein LOC109174723 [Ipomoea nil]|uniref:uncharacterized protein LOC109174723 n=1 Tax=Ipomoea nil TaxID=35883 RepID=UPI0009009126|nr:PREDICTED: uncharacterized protein LOC109174723 [Ipomoea nil]